MTLENAIEVLEKAYDNLYGSSRIAFVRDNNELIQDAIRIALPILRHTSGVVEVKK